MTETGINFQNPIAARRQRFAIATKVCINHAAILRRPDYAHLLLLARQRFQQLAGVVFTNIVEDCEKRY